MLFEVDDLSEASPATVSRCGMVYMEPDRIGCRIMFSKWLNNVPKSLLTQGRDTIISEATHRFIPLVEQKLFGLEVSQFCLPNLSKHWLFASYMRFVESLLMGELSREQVLSHE